MGAGGTQHLISGGEFSLPPPFILLPTPLLLPSLFTGTSQAGTVARSTLSLTSATSQLPSISLLLLLSAPSSCVAQGTFNIVPQPGTAAESD